MATVFEQGLSRLSLHGRMNPLINTHTFHVTDSSNSVSDLRRSASRSSKHPQYDTLQARLDSFVSWPGRYVPKTPEELSTAGFFYIGSADRVTCFQCGITLRDWEEEHDPVTEHRRYSENCEFIYTPDLNQLGVVTRSLPATSPSSNTPDRVGKEQEPLARDDLCGPSKSNSLKHPEYDCIVTRLETFSKWPMQLFQKYFDMSAAGFFYTEEADLVTCYRCGISHEHNQTEQHLKHAKECLRDHKSPPQQVHLAEREPGEGLTVSHSHVRTGSDGFDTSGIRPGPAAALSMNGDQMIEPEEAIDSVGSDELFGDGQSKNTGQQPMSASCGMSRSEACNCVMSGSPKYHEDVITGNTSNDVIFRSEACNDVISGSDACIDVSLGSPEYHEDVIPGNTSNDVMSNTAKYDQLTASKGAISGASRDVKPDSSDYKMSRVFRNMSGVFRNIMPEASNNEMPEEPKDALQGNPKEAPVTPEAPDIMAAKAHDDGSEVPVAIAAEPEGDESEVPDDLLLGMKNKFMKYMACFGLDKK